MKFTDLTLVPELQKSIADAGFIDCTDVQEETFGITLNGKDVLVQSQTGTGKTAAFLISLFQIIETSEYRERAIIIVPTRELAVQIEAEAKLLSVHLEYNILAVYGGVGYDKQIKSINNDVEILIGTPGRLIDLSNKKILDLKKYTLAVLDEADRMLDMGFVDDIRKILRRTPNKFTRQTMLFSATLAFQVKLLAKSFMNDPAEIAISPETLTVDKINQKLYHVSVNEKIKLLLGVLKKYNSQHVLIFSNMKSKCEELAIRLKMNGFEAAFLTGDLPQSKRQRTVDRFKGREIPILIATDVAARGIHVDDLELVINYDIPQHTENYVHRIGRTARAGKSGNAITFACEEFVEFLAPIEKLLEIKIPSEVPDSELFEHDESEGKNWRRHKPTRNRQNRNRSGSGREQGSYSGKSSRSNSTYTKKSSQNKRKKAPQHQSEKSENSLNEHRRSGHSERNKVQKKNTTSVPTTSSKSKGIIGKIGSMFGK